MKKIVYVIVMLTSFQFSCNSQQKSNDNQTNNISYTQVFLEKEISTFKIKKYKELFSKTIIIYTKTNVFRGEKIWKNY